MSLDANEFFPSNETGTRSTTFDEGDHLFTVLRTHHRIATARSIPHEWNTATTLSALTREWSSQHENRTTERNSFSLMLYNISSLRMHLEDLIEHISESYPNIWALTGLRHVAIPRLLGIGIGGFDEYWCIGSIGIGGTEVLVALVLMSTEVLMVLVLMSIDVLVALVLMSIDVLVVLVLIVLALVGIERY